MQLFLELKKHFKSLGIEPNQGNSFGTKNVIPLILFVYCFSATAWFLLFEPDKTFFDLGNAFYGVVCFPVSFFNLLSIVLKQTKIFMLIGKIEEIIGNSKFQFLYFYGKILTKWKMRIKLSLIRLQCSK